MRTTPLTTWLWRTGWDTNPAIASGGANADSGIICRQFRRCCVLGDLCQRSVEYIIKPWVRLAALT